MYNPLFSILIANYNGRKFLRECIASVLKQTYSNWEIVLVDDGSTDNSLEILDIYANDKRIKIFRRIENKGCTFTKAECLQYAKGEICGFLDSDDMIAPNAIEKMVDAHKDDAVSIVSSRYIMINEEGTIIGKNRLLQFDGKSYLELGDYSQEHFVSFKKSSYDSSKGLNEMHVLGDDQELYLLLEEVGKWNVLDEFLYYYRINNTSISKTKPYECYFWNMMVRYEACVRRKLNPAIVLRDYLNIIEEYAKNEVYKKEFEIRSSKSYKLGHLLLKPFMKLKKYIRNNRLSK